MENREQRLNVVLIMIKQGKKMDEGLIKGLRNNISVGEN